MSRQHCSVKVPASRHPGQRTGTTLAGNGCLFCFGTQGLACDPLSFYAPTPKKEAQNLIVESCRDDMRKTVAARGFVKGRGPSKVEGIQFDDVILTINEAAVKYMTFEFASFRYGLLPAACTVSVI